MKSVVVLLLVFIIVQNECAEFTVTNEAELRSALKKVINLKLIELMKLINQQIVSRDKLMIH